MLPAHRTAGNHCKLLRPVVLVLARLGDLPHGDLVALHLVSATDPSVDSEVTSIDVYEALIGEQGAEGQRYCWHTYKFCIAVEIPADRILRTDTRKGGV